jgi:BioD-like phosphotransacetylase family protein
MAQLQIVSANPSTGRTTVAVGLALGLASAGRQVQLARRGSGLEAEADAATFGALAGVIGVPVPAPPDFQQMAGVFLISEAAPGDAAKDQPALLVVRGAMTEADVALGMSLGANLFGTIATLVAPPAVEGVARELTNAGLRPLAILTEDRLLASPGVDDIRVALGAEVLSRGEGLDDSVDDVVIAPVYTDPARPHFRRYENKAVFTPSYKTDLALAALESGSLCLVFTGGHRPSHYVLDRAEHEPATLLLAPQATTIEAISTLSDVWTNSRFRGARKAQRVAALLGARLDFSALANRLGA